MLEVLSKTGIINLFYRSLVHLLSCLKLAQNLQTGKMWRVQFQKNLPGIRQTMSRLRIHLSFTSCSLSPHFYPCELTGIKYSSKNMAFLGSQRYLKVRRLIELLLFQRYYIIFFDPLSTLLMKRENKIDNNVVFLVLIEYV